MKRPTATLVSRGLEGAQLRGDARISTAAVFGNIPIPPEQSRDDPTKETGSRNREKEKPISR